MDFNKWIYHGIPYINAKYEKVLTDSLMDSNINFYNPDNIKTNKQVNLFRSTDKEKYEQFQVKFQNFLFSDKKAEVFDNYPKFFLNYIFNNLNENIRKRIYLQTQNIDG